MKSDYQKIFGGNNVLHLVDKKNNAICGEKYPSMLVTIKDVQFFKTSPYKQCEKCLSIINKEVVK